MRYSVDAASSVPIYEQLVRQITRAIVDGTLPARTKMPAAKELATSLDVNVHTVLHAYQDLRDAGLVELRRGRGTIVAAQHDDFSAHARSIRAVVDEALAASMPPAAIRAAVDHALDPGSANPAEHPRSQEG